MFFTCNGCISSRKVPMNSYENAMEWNVVVQLLTASVNLNFWWKCIWFISDNNAPIWYWCNRSLKYYCYWLDWKIRWSIQLNKMGIFLPHHILSIRAFGNVGYAWKKCVWYIDTAYVLRLNDIEQNIYVFVVNHFSAWHKKLRQSNSMIGCMRIRGVYAYRYI